MSSDLSPRHPTIKEHIKLRRHEMKTTPAESQGDSYPPADGHRVIPNKMTTKSKTNIKRMTTDN